MKFRNFKAIRIADLDLNNEEYQDFLKFLCETYPDFVLANAIGDLDCPAIFIAITYYDDGKIDNGWGRKLELACQDEGIEDNETILLLI